MCDNKIPEFIFKGRLLDKYEVGCFLQLQLMLKKKSDVEIALIDDKEISNDFGSQILLKRIESYNLPFMISNLFYIMSVETWVKNPGKVMMLLRLLYQEWKKSGKQYFNLEDWTLIFFPYGVPTDEEQEKWWDSQKSFDEPLGNMVDNSSYWR